LRDKATDVYEELLALGPGPSIEEFDMRVVALDMAKNLNESAKSNEALKAVEKALRFDTIKLDSTLLSALELHAKLSNRRPSSSRAVALTPNPSPWGEGSRKRLIFLLFLPLSPGRGGPGGEGPARLDDGRRRISLKRLLTLISNNSLLLLPWCWA